MSTKQMFGPPQGREVDLHYAPMKYWLVNPSTAAPVAAQNLTGVVDYNPDPIGYEKSEKVFHAGGGRAALHERFGPNGKLTLKFKGSYFQTHFASWIDSTFGTTNFALPMVAPEIPLIHLEIPVCYPNGTHWFSLVYPDLMLENPAVPVKFDNSPVDVTFKFENVVPFILYAGHEMVYDVFDTDGSTLNFTPSSTPVNLVTTTDLEREEWVLPEFVNVKYKSSTANAGAVQTSDVSFSTDITFGTAKATGGQIQALYAKASS